MIKDKIIEWLGGITEKAYEKLVDELRDLTNKNIALRSENKMLRNEIRFLEEKERSNLALIENWRQECTKRDERIMAYEAKYGPL